MSHIMNRSACVHSTERPASSFDVASLKPAYQFSKTGYTHAHEHMPSHSDIRYTSLEDTSSGLKTPCNASEGGHIICHKTTHSEAMTRCRWIRDTYSMHLCATTAADEDAAIDAIPALRARCADTMEPYVHTLGWLGAW